MGLFPAKVSISVVRKRLACIERQMRTYNDAL